MYKGYLTDIKGIEVGHAQDQDGITGCTVILARQGAVGGIDIRGGAPATRETDIFNTKMAAPGVIAIVLTGGSTYGLASADGVMDYQEEEGLGSPMGPTTVSAVPAAVIFDFNIGDYRVRPDRAMGYEAAKNASSSENRQGNIGVGIGATVGKGYGPDYSLKGGLGSATVEVGDIKVSAMVAVNAYGDVYNPETGEIIARPYDRENKKFLKPTKEIIKDMKMDREELKTNTTIGIIATNASLSKGQANKVASMAHNGFARAIDPVHTYRDGDTIFVMATGERKSDLYSLEQMEDINLIGTMAAEAMGKAIVNAVVKTESLGGYPAYKDIKKQEEK